MNEWDVIEQMGRLPYKILLKGGKMVSKVWKCSNCKIVTTNEAEIRPPAPCVCGSIFFEKVNQ
jgi:hypothetical protein